ncbi:hypothetical protein LZ30DRAFT_730968 [Colletotrichum cereale]|nr:hypothetical protein LZ30DRAFT_730968 [Colletotrichum cereale]
MTRDQQTQLDQITATSEDGKWFAMWAVLFPDTEPPSSPYVDPEDLGGFMAGEVHRLCRPLYRALLRPVMDDDHFERHYTLLVQNSSSYFSTFSRPLGGPLNTSLEDLVRDSLGEPQNAAARGFSPVMSPSAFLPQTPQARSYTLANDDRQLDAGSSHITDPTGSITIPERMLDHSEITVEGPIFPEGTSQLMWAFTAGQFPRVDNSQYTNTVFPLDRYQQANPNPSTGFFDVFGVRPADSYLDAGYNHARQIYDPELSQHSSLTDFYEFRGPQQLHPAASAQYPSRPQEIVFNPGQAYTPQPSGQAAILEGFMNHDEDDNYTSHITSPGMIGLRHVARHRFGGHAPAPVNDDTLVRRGRRQQNTGP